MKILPFVIEKFAKLILGGVPFESIKRIVLSYQNEALSGSQKREMAFAQIKSMSYLLEDFAINLGIELAVYWAKSKLSNSK